jgi:hypothetical protein
MRDIEHAKRRIRKLLALSGSPNENEALAALEKARALMDEYRLSEAACVFEEIKVTSTKTAVLWRFVIANRVAWLYGCDHHRDIYRDHGAEVFTGEETDSFLAAETYRYLTRAVERIAKRNIRKNAKQQFRRDYKLGMAFRLEERIQRMGDAAAWRDRRESKLRAVKAHIKNTVVFNPDLDKPAKKKKTKGMKMNFTAISRGENAADGISLNRQAAGGGQWYLEGF